MEEFPMSVMLSTFVQEAQVSNFGKVTGCLELGYSCFSLMSPGEYWDNTFK
jgi:hypothetical protein